MMEGIKLESQKKYQEYLDNILSFLELDLDNPKAVVKAIKSGEPEKRVQYDEDTGSFGLGMVKWPAEKVATELKLIRKAVIQCLDSTVANGCMGEAEVDALNGVRHDLKIQHIHNPDCTTGLKLSYVVPDSKIAWDEGCCPHCGETVTIHLFPDPIPIIAYEAIINTLRLATRSVVLKKGNVRKFDLA